MSCKPDFYFKPTGIGSVPWKDIDKTCNKILDFLPVLPFWPQLIRRSPLEDMNIQFSEGLPLLSINKETKSVSVSDDNSEEALVNFYSHYLAEDIDYFAISREYAPGLYRQIELVSEDPGNLCEYIKGHITGPVTFAASVKDKEVSDWMIDVHHTLWRGRNTGYAYEGLIHAYELARRRGDKEHQAKLACTIDIGLEYLLEWQVGGPLANRFARRVSHDHRLAVGGIQNLPHGPGLRIDVTQHQMHAILLARRYVYREGAAPWP